GRPPTLSTSTQAPYSSLDRRCASGGAAEHVSKVVVDRVQVLRLGIDRGHLDDEAVADDAIAERLLHRVRAVPGEMHRLAVARTHPRALHLVGRSREMLDRIGLDQLPKQVAPRRAKFGRR